MRYVFLSVIAVTIWLQIEVYKRTVEPKESVTYTLPLPENKYEIFKRRMELFSQIPIAGEYIKPNIKKSKSVD